MMTNLFGFARHHRFAINFFLIDLQNKFRRKDFFFAITAVGLASAFC